MTGNFKAGDIIICIDSFGSDILVKGHQYVVTKSDECWFLIDIDNHKNLHYPAHRFRLMPNYNNIWNNL